MSFPFKIYLSLALTLLSFPMPGRGQSVPCDAAKNQTVETSGLCVGCYADNPEFAVDNNQATFSTLHVILGLLDGYIQQQLIFPTKSGTGDSVKIFLTAPVGLLDLTLLGSISVATYNGEVYNQDRMPVNSGLLQARLINGYQILLTWAPTRPFDKVEVRLNSGVLQLLNAININYAYRISPQPLALLSEVKVCTGTTAALGVKSLDGVTYDWYKQPTGGNPIFTGINYNSGPVTGDSLYYVQATRNSCPNLSRTLIRVSPAPLPLAPEVKPPVADICSGTQATFITASRKGLTHRWFNQPTAGIALAEQDTFTTTILTANTNFYAETIDTMGCVSPNRTSVAVNMLPPGPGVSMSGAQTLGGTGGDRLSAIVKGVDGGFLAAGSTSSNDGDINGQNHGLLDFWLVKLDSVNNKKWVKTIGTSGRDSLTGIAATKDLKYIICGNYNLGTAAASGQIICINSAGDILWNKATNLLNQFVDNLSDGSNCIVIGTSVNNLQLTLLNSAGNVLKTANYTGNYSTDQIQFAQTDDKGLLIAGSTFSGSIYGRDAFVTRIDSNLNRQWEQVFLAEGDDIKVGIRRTSDKYYALTSITRNNTGQQTQARVIQLTPNGTVQFSKVFGPFSSAGMNVTSGNRKDSVTNANTRNLLLLFDRPTEPVFQPRKENTVFAVPTDFLGDQYTKALGIPAISNDVLNLMELDSTGKIVAWQQDTSHFFIPQSAVRTSDGGALMVGATTGASGKAILAKVDPPSCLPGNLQLLPQDAKALFVKENVPAGNLNLTGNDIILTVSPNPFSQTLNCRYEAMKTGRIALKLINVASGQSIILKNETATKGIYHLQINTGHYPAGVYILQLDQDGRKDISRVVKIN